MNPRIRKFSFIGKFLIKAAGVLENAALSAIRLENRFPPLFIVGAPRSGTTVVYLHLVNTFKFGYFPNIAKRWPRSCVSAVFIGKLLYKYRATYQNDFGIVSGPLAPSDGWSIFHRWFPEYDYTHPVNKERLYELRNIVRLYEVNFRAPLINKNNSNSVRIGYLQDLFPNAFFIYIKRDPVDTVLSLLEARQKHHTPACEWWGAAPPQFFNQSFSSDVERSVYQVWGVDTYIQKSLEQILPHRKYTVSYEVFCRQPAEVEHWVYSSYENLNIRLTRKQGTDNRPFQMRVRARRPDLENRISAIFDRLRAQNSG